MKYREIIILYAALLDKDADELSMEEMKVLSATLKESEPDVDAYTIVLKTVQKLGLILLTRRLERGLSDEEFEIYSRAFKRIATLREVLRYAVFYIKKREYSRARIDIDVMTEQHMKRKGK